MVVVCHAPGVGTALDVAAGIDTSVGALHRLTDLVVPAFKIVFAGGRLTACLEILSVTLEPWLTQALTRRTNCIGSTSHVGTEISNGRLFRVTPFKWISLVSSFTSTVITSDCVDADSMVATKVFSTLIHIKTANVGVAIVARLTLAYLALTVLIALGIVSASTVICIHRRCTAFIGIAGEPCIADTLVWQSIGTVTVDPATGNTEWRQDGWHAQEVSIADKAFLAEAFIGVLVTDGVYSTGRGVTALTALARDAGQGLGAGVGCGAGLGITATTREGVAVGSLGAGTGRPCRRDDALCVETAHHAIAHGSTLAVLVLLVASLAPAPGRMILGDTDGGITAGQLRAGVDTD